MSFTLCTKRSTRAAFSSFGVFTALFLTSPSFAQHSLVQSPFTIAATANIFGAGYADAPAPGGFGGGTVAPTISFSPAAGTDFTFGSFSGQVSYSGGEQNGPDGNAQAFSAESYRSLSGVTDPHGTFYLLGVFTNGVPSGPAPTQFNFTNKSAPSYRPLLNQVFFIGDGLTGTGTGSVQQFFAPSGANQLTLGFADADAQGNIGSYRDNSGQLTANVTENFNPVPELSSATGFLLLAFLGAGLIVRKTLKSSRPFLEQNASLN